MVPRVLQISGLLIFRRKKAKFRGIFRGKFAEKSADFAGFSREKSQNLRKNRPILQDFRGKKVKIHRKKRPISRDCSGKKPNYEGFSGANYKKNRLISREISGGKLRQETISKKQPISLDFFGGKLAKINQFCVDMTSVF